MRRSYRVDCRCTCGHVHVMIPDLILESGLAKGGKRDWDELAAGYGAMLMESLGVMGTRGKHVDVLQHLMEFPKNHLSGEDKQELLGLIEDYRQGLLHLIVPLALLKHHLNRYPVPDWVHQQLYLHPYPMERMLRNHV